MGKKFVCRAGICNIASAFPRNKKLLAKFFVLFKNAGLFPLFRRRNGSHHTGCPSAYNNYFVHYSKLLL